MSKLSDKEERIIDLETQVKVLQRQLDNSKVLISTTEKFARLAQAKEAKAISTSRKTRERLSNLEAQIQIKKLQGACYELDNEMKKKKRMMKEITFGECLTLPSKTVERRHLKALEKDIEESQKLRDGQNRLLCSLIDHQNKIEDMRNAAAKGDLETVEKLLKLGISVNMADTSGISAFKYACGQGHLRIVRAMANVADINNMDGGVSPLHHAVKQNQAVIVDFLLQNKASINELDGCETSLHLACKRGNLNIFRSLIEAGADVNKANRFGNTPLHILSQANSGCLNREEMASRLLEQGADDGIKNLDGLTPLMIAQTQRMYGVLQVLKDARDP